MSYSASVSAGMVPWFVVLVSQLRFREAHRAALKNHPFKSIMFPYTNYRRWHSCFVCWWAWQLTRIRAFLCLLAGFLLPLCHLFISRWG